MGAARVEALRRVRREGRQKRGRAAKLVFARLVRSRARRLLAGSARKLRNLGRKINTVAARAASAVTETAHFFAQGPPSPPRWIDEALRSRGPGALRHTAQRRVRY